MKYLLTTTLALVSLAANTTPAFAGGEVGFGMSSQLVRSSSLDAISESDFMHGGAWNLAYRLAPTPLGRIALDYSGHSGSTEGVLFQRIDASLHQVQFMLGIRVERDVWKRLSVHSRFAAGFHSASLKLDGVAPAGTPIHAFDYAAVFSLHGGTDYHLLGDRSKGQSLAARFELGYTLASKLNFESTPSRDGDDVIRIPEQLESLGSVGLSGFGLRLGLVWKF